MTAAVDQLALLDDRGQTHVGGHDTERAAARSVNAGTIRRCVLDLLRAHPEGLTDDAGAVLLAQTLGGDCDRLTFGRRRQELYRAGLVVKTGDRRLTPRGRSAIVWQATS